MAIRSEEVAKRYFEILGFRIRDRDFGRKKGAGFFIELDNCIQSVEAKTKMGEWLQFLKPQIDPIRDGGLVARAGKETTKFQCPNCREITIWRCDRCRIFGRLYKCPICVFEGPQGRLAS